MNKNRMLFSSDVILAFGMAIEVDVYSQDGIPKEITTPDHVQSKLGRPRIQRWVSLAGNRRQGA